MSKKTLLDSKVLVHFDPSLPLVVTADSSSYGLGAVLAHVVNGVEQPICFASRTLNDAERRYSQVEREALGLVFALRKFHNYVYGRHFTLVTDHKPLLGIFSCDKAIPAMATGRIQRWCLFLTAYKFDLIHKSGTSIGNADALSRLPLPIVNEAAPVPAEWIYLMEFLQDTPVTAEKIAKWTTEDTIFSQVKGFAINGWPSKVQDANLLPYFRVRNEMAIIGGCLLWGSRVIIPPQGRKTLLSELHAEHVGASRMKELARRYIWWPGLDSDLENLVGECSTCLNLRKAPPKATLHP